MSFLKILLKREPAHNGGAAMAQALPSDGLEAFGSEFPVGGDAGHAAGQPSASGPRRSIPLRWRRIGLLVATPLIVSAAGGATLVYRLRPAQPAMGALRVETVPSVAVTLDGKAVGRTPLALSLAPGTYSLRLGDAPGARTEQVSVVAGTSILQHYELAPAAPAAPLTGALRVQTDPPGLKVSIDGTEAGVTPLTVAQVGVGEHRVAVHSGTTVLTRAVRVEAGETVSVILGAAPKPDAAAAMTAGWIAVQCPLPLKVREDGAILGTTDVDRLMLPSGRHVLEFGDEALGFQVQRTLTVAAGKTTTTTIEVPNGTMSLNASPWAEVFVDGARMGETPLGNVAVRIGRHEVVFRHPELGEKRETVLVTTAGPARLGVDLRKK